MGKPRILILGAGYGGLVTALKLQKRLHYNEAEITLVNKHHYHYFTTELHLPAAGTMHHDQARVAISDLIDGRKINFVQAQVKRIHPGEQRVELDDGELHYDYLVIGLGSQPETFGIEGLKENAFSIRSIDSARLIRQHMEYLFSKYAQEPERTDYLTVVVGGAGFTGIEFVGELTERLPQLCREYDIDPKLVRLINIEAAPTILPGFDPALVNYAMEVLERKGVEFRIGTPIKRCTPEGVIVGTDGGEEEIKAGTVVWTGGVRGNAIIDEAGFQADRGRIKVDPYLRVPGYEQVFCVGDCALIVDEDKERPYPPTAQLAIQHGENVAHNLTALIRDGSLTPFKPHIRGTVASLGPHEAIGVVGDIKVYGTVASWLKKLIDMRYLYIIGGLSLVIKKGRF